MNVRWMAVLTGLVVDVLLSTLIGLAAGPVAESFAVAPDLTRPGHLVLLGLYLLCTAVGGYLAGRIAGEQHLLHGLLVGVIGVILTQLPAIGGDPMPRVYVVGSAAGCLTGTLGGLVSRAPPPPHR